MTDAELATQAKAQEALSDLLIDGYLDSHATPEEREWRKQQRERTAQIEALSVAAGYSEPVETPDERRLREHEETAIATKTLDRFIDNMRATHERGVAALRAQGDPPRWQVAPEHEQQRLKAAAWDASHNATAEQQRHAELVKSFGPKDF